jgi:hypothetical protein
MPFGVPPHVEPWTRNNWANINKGCKLYATQEWQCWLIRHGNPVPDLPQNIADEVGKPTSWLSTKAQNMLRNIVPQPPDISPVNSEAEHGDQRGE